MVGSQRFTVAVNNLSHIEVGEFYSHGIEKLVLFKEEGRRRRSIEKLVLTYDNCFNVNKHLCTKIV